MFNLTFINWSPQHYGGMWINLYLWQMSSIVICALARSWRELWSLTVQTRNRPLATLHQHTTCTHMTGSTQRLLPQGMHFWSGISDVRTPYLRVPKPLTLPTSGRKTRVNLDVTTEWKQDWFWLLFDALSTWAKTIFSSFPWQRFRNFSVKTDSLQKPI